MEVKAVPLAPDVLYYLDNALEENQISGATNTALRLFGDRGTVMRIVDADHGPGAFGRRARDVALDDYAHEIMAGAPADVRDAYVAIGLLSSIREIHGAIDCLAGWNFEDSTIGGGLLPYRKVWRCDDDYNYNPTPRLRRRLYAAAAIRRYVRRSEEVLPQARKRADRFRTMPWPATSTAASRLLSLFDQQHEATQRELRRQAQMVRYVTGGREIATGRIGFTRPQRRMIRRSAHAAETMLGRDAVRAFVSGQSVEISGRHMVLQVSRGSSIASMGHGALDISVAAPDGSRLAKLCFFIAKTPALDQLAAVALFVQAGEERKVFNTGNLYAIGPDAYQHPLIRSHVKTRTTDQRRSDFDRRRAAADAYTMATFDTYFDAALTHVWRSDTHRLRRWAQQEAS